MSLLYRVAEKACYELNSLPGGGVKGLMLMESKVLADKEELPRSMYRKGLKIKTINFEGFKIHIFKDRNIRLAFEEYDPILNVKMNDIIAENWCRNVPLNSSDISPEYIDYKDFPPMFFFYGKHELFYPHVMNYLYSLRKQGIEFSEEVESMCHDWALCCFFPEGRRAIRKMCKWIMN